MEVNDILFRCSELGNIMIEPKSKSEKISETTKSYLVDVYVRNKYLRNNHIVNKYTMKGLGVEEDSLTIYSMYKKTFFKKNEDRIGDKFIIGTPDIFEGENIFEAKKIIDIKSSWDIFTFFKTKTKKINQMYYWQLQGYMALTGAKESTLAYCLTNTPEVLINDEKRRLQWKMGVLDTNDDFEKACEEIERLSIYDDIPLEERVIEFNIDRNNNDIYRMYERVIDCRRWINENLIKI